ncbi:hypothetical protein SAMN02799630_02787 [Paenibacillus sp. UNCCL117]|uniref:hypothetical protein n=1 Tax=unclassified Paenibacillus TaxID=185978 RepID=UPI000885B551|nr:MULTISPECIES: hypothetical protein [unclassified Paenibacillus]SDD27463.1 hypothetical protein SAMN04488602_107125 [Paenibacillus sp. cl123]SFW40532.1 hypothetical protein SAMN02799630_02787 [Paenibacillus sp. UNCCL117]
MSESEAAKEALVAAITDHAYDQYCSRVEKVSRGDLVALVQQQLDDLDYDYRKKSFIHLAGIWWVYTIEDNRFVMVTCYGRSDWNVPHALHWARSQKDRLDFTKPLEV